MTDEQDHAGVTMRWQTRFYRSYLTHALKKLASDPNPAVQAIGQHMDRCLRCPHTERCGDCPFGRNGAQRLRAVP